MSPPFEGGVMDWGMKSAHIGDVSLQVGHSKSDTSHRCEYGGTVFRNELLHRSAVSQEGAQGAVVMKGLHVDSPSRKLSLTPAPEEQGGILGWSSEFGTREEENLRVFRLQFDNSKVLFDRNRNNWKLLLDLT